MIPLSKLFSLIANPLSRPIIEMMKSTHYFFTTREGPFNRFVTRLGTRRYWKRVEINHRILNIRTDVDMFSEPLHEEVALEYGVHYFYERLFITLVVLKVTHEAFKLLRTSLQTSKFKDVLQESNAELEGIIQTADQWILEYSALQESLKWNYPVFTLEQNYRPVLKEKELYVFLKEAELARKTISAKLEKLEPYKISTKSDKGGRLPSAQYDLATDFPQI